MTLERNTCHIDILTENHVVLNKLKKEVSHPAQEPYDLRDDVGLDSAFN